MLNDPLVGFTVEHDGQENVSLLNFKLTNRKNLKTSLVSTDFPKGSVHEHMSKFYGCDYQESKNRSFQYLYGHIPQEVIETNPFFEKVHKYINKTWKLYKTQKFIQSDIYSKKIYRKNQADMNRNKIFNYIIQLMETENNMKILTNLIPFMESYKSKLILYSYDSYTCNKRII